MEHAVLPVAGCLALPPPSPQGVQIFLGGAVGEHAELGSKFETAVPAEDDDLVPRLREILIDKFGAKLRK